MSRAIGSAWLLLTALWAACNLASPSSSGDGGASGDAATTHDANTTALDLGDGATDQSSAVEHACPCELGSYCDLATNRCKSGCLGDDHCPSGLRCDTTVFLCTEVCETNADCDRHLACKSVGGGSLCATCQPGFADCNGDPRDGCEASLNTATDCEECGKPGTVQCYPDADGDGYIAADAVLTTMCSCNDHAVAPFDPKAMKIDCDDTDPSVDPDGVRTKPTPTQSGSFDYNCDGLESPWFTVVDGTCSAACKGYWWEGEMPACGETGSFFSCQLSSSGCHPALYPDTPQPCG